MVEIVVPGTVKMTGISTDKIDIRRGTKRGEHLGNMNMNMSEITIDS